ncbi:STAS domain-containing protein [Yoonia maritima]|uniref:STAS domain-containing protein n=1 Tax=Yoonia maritima TaxID=1435347 RepID=UPI000D10B1AD|nr:STAS domain-containing protein [Yoonia maritima]
MIHTTRHNDEITVIRPGVERLTAVNAREFKDEVSTLIEQGAYQLVIDFKDVSFLDSSGLGVLVGILKKVGSRGELTVCSLGASIEQMFRISRMDRVFTSYPNAEIAVQSMSERL